MDGQLTIFDWLSPDPDAIENMSEATIAERISTATGLQLTYNNKFECYQADLKKLKIIVRVEKQQYAIPPHNEFIGVDVNNKHAGASSPCDSIDEAIKFIEKQVERLAREVRHG